MKYAYLNRNFKKLSFEERVIFLSHAATALFCFFPWISVEPLYDEPYWNSAFSGPGALIGAFIFGVSLLVALFFLDQIMETKRVNLPFASRYLFYGAGAEQLIFLVLSWSVLMSVTRDFESSEIRFGIFACLLAQVVGLVSAYLYAQAEQKKKAKSFFQHPASSETQKVADPKETLGGLFEEESSDEISDDKD